MRVEHHDIATPERLAPDGAVEIIQALHPAAHERAQHDRRVLVKGRAEHRRDRQDDVPIDDPLVEDLAHLADPVVDVDFGAPQAQRRFTAHRHQMLALATLQAAVFDIAHLLWVATRQHLGHQAIIVGRLVARMGMLKRLPVVGKDLLEDTPVPQRVLPSSGRTELGGYDCCGAAVVPRFTRFVHPSSACTRAPSPASLILEPRGLPGPEK